MSGLKPDRGDGKRGRFASRCRPAVGHRPFVCPKRKRPLRAQRPFPYAL